MEATSPARQPRGHVRVEQILRATLAVIGRAGVAGVTHRTVAEEAGVPLGSLTYYFASKQELLREALRLHVREDAGRLRALAADLLASGASAEDVVAAFTAEMEGGHPDIAQFELYLEAARDPQLRDVAAESLRAYQEVAALALRAAGIPDPEAKAGVVVATIDGLGVHRGAAGAQAPALRDVLGQLLAAWARG
ncbi:MAG: TetR family transcriptional regulator [Solirubrobacteraceae bacterium]|nr:TetR family transcriptional regulator [Solirubrobacteraceae bacterium]